MSVFQDIIDDELDLEDSHISLSSKTNQRSVCLFGGCYSGCLISDWFLAEPGELMHCLKEQPVTNFILQLTELICIFCPLTWVIFNENKLEY